MVSHEACPSVMSLVPGPIEPATKRGRSRVLNLSAAARAHLAALTLSS